MAETTPAEDQGGGLAPRQQSLLRSSLVMASGTLLSRLLGFLRNALLIAAVGVSLGVADAFGAANMLPNSVYNLLAAGVFDAILIPQIVRALKQKNGTVYVNRLLTAAGTILFAITVLAMIGAPLLLMITSSGLPPDVRALAITFAIWCLPQIFFYGLYNLLGEVLNARGIFGPYMWAPVMNNIISIAGLGIFLYVWGPSGTVFPAGEFTSAQLYVLAGSATLGVVLQALVLLIPLRKSGVKLRPDFRFRETNFGSASKVAGWTFATLMVSQLGVFSTTNLASRAVGWAEETGTLVASLPAYNTAFMIYMVPQSLIALTLATAIFTRLANNVADSDYVAVARNYTMGVRIIVLLSMLAVAIILVAALPMMQLIMPTFHAEEASLYSWVVVALIMGVPSTGIVMISQRVFFAFENAKPVFLMGLIPTAVQLIIGWTIFFTMSGEWWTVGAALAETICRILQGFIAIFWTAYLVRTINAGRLIAYYVRYLIAFAISALVGWGVLTLIGPGSFAPSTMARFMEAFGKLLVVTLVVTVVYFTVLHFVDRSGTDMLKRYIGERIPEGKRPAFLQVESESDLQEDVEPGDARSELTLGDEEDTLTTQLPLGASLAAGIQAGQVLGGNLTTPTWDEIIAGDYASRSITRSLGGMPDVATGQMPLLRKAASGVTDTPEGILLRDESAEEPPATTDTPSGLPSPGEEIDGPVGTPEEEAEETNETGLPDDAEATNLEDGKESSYDSFDALLTGERPGEVSGEQLSEDRVHYSPTSSAPTPVVSVAPPAAENFLFTQQSSPNTPPPGSRNTASSYRFNPTVPALILAGLLLIFGIVFATNQLRAPLGTPLSDSLGMSGEQSGAQSGEQSGAKAEEAPEEAPGLPAPVISTIWVSSWNDDGGDHPELVDALTDGDPESLWYTRYYDLNEFAEDQMISLLLNLEQESLVSEITLDVQGSGGEVIIRQPEGDNPRVGPVLATSTMDGLTTIKLAQPTKLSKVGITFVSLPTDYEGLNRAQVAELTIK